MRIPPIQNSYVAALLKLHEQRLERLRIDPEIAREYAKILRLRKRLRLALDQKKAPSAPFSTRVSRSRTEKRS
ncbi:hypothetical protein ABIC03_000064 [Bradyrhizobium sp. RT6a]